MRSGGRLVLCGCARRSAGACRRLYRIRTEALTGLCQCALDAALKISPDWPLKDASHLLAAALRPPRTQLTSASYPTRGRRTSPVRSDPVPARHTREAAIVGPQKLNGHDDQKQAPARTVTKPGEPGSLRLSAVAAIAVFRMRSPCPPSSPRCWPPGTCGPHPGRF